MHTRAARTSLAIGLGCADRFRSFWVVGDCAQWPGQRSRPDHHQPESAAGGTLHTNLDSPGFLRALTTRPVALGLTGIPPEAQTRKPNKLEALPAGRPRQREAPRQSCSRARRCAPWRPLAFQPRLRPCWERPGRYPVTGSPPATEHPAGIRPCWERPGTASPGDWVSSSDWGFHPAAGFSSSD